ADRDPPRVEAAIAVELRHRERAGRDETLATVMEAPAEAVRPGLIVARYKEEVLAVEVRRRARERPVLDRHVLTRRLVLDGDCASSPRRRWDPVLDNPDVDGADPGGRVRGQGLERGEARGGR